MASDLAFPWARTYDAEQLAAFIEDLWGAASGNNDLATLRAIEKVIAEHRPDDATPCPLTGREVEILTQLASGETYESTARNLGISTNSVRARCPQIYARLGAKNAAHAAVIASHRGWIADLHIPDPIEQVPRILQGPLGWNRIYHEHAVKLRKRPGKELKLGPYGSRSGARNAARRIRRGQSDAFQPAGAFDAQAEHTGHGPWVVLVRYIGTPASTAQKAAS